MPTPSSIASRDANRVPTMIAVSDVDFVTLVAVSADPTTGALQIGGTVTATNPSVDTTGSAVPASATFIGVKNGANLVGLTEGQATMANSLPVSIASDQTAVSVSQSGTWNIGTVTSITNMVTVSQATASNLKAQVVSGDATGSAVPANAYYKAGIAKTSLPTAATDGNLTGAMVDKFGRQVVLIGSIRDLTGTQTTTISASTSETTIVTAAASTFNDLVMLIVSNTSASTNTRIDFRDTTGGSVLFSLESIGGAAPIGFALPVPIPQTSVNTNWTAQCATSTTDIRIYAVFVKNK